MKILVFNIVSRGNVANLSKCLRGIFNDHFIVLKVNCWVGQERKKNCELISISMRVFSDHHVYRWLMKIKRSTVYDSAQGSPFCPLIPSMPCSPASPCSICGTVHTHTSNTRGTKDAKIYARCRRNHRALWADATSIKATFLDIYKQNKTYSNNQSVKTYLYSKRRMSRTNLWNACWQNKVE